MEMWMPRPLLTLSGVYRLPVSLPFANFSDSSGIYRAYRPSEAVGVVWCSHLEAEEIRIVCQTRKESPLDSGDCHLEVRFARAAPKLDLQLAAYMRQAGHVKPSIHARLGVLFGGRHVHLHRLQHGTCLVRLICVPGAMSLAFLRLTRAVEDYNHLQTSAKQTLKPLLSTLNRREKTNKSTESPVQRARKPHRYER